MKRDTEIGIIAGIVLAIIIGAFIATRPGIKEPAIPLSDTYEGRKAGVADVLDLGLATTQQPTPEIAELPEEVPVEEPTAPYAAEHDPATEEEEERAVVREEWDTVAVEDEWKEEAVKNEWEDEVVEAEWEEIEQPPSTVAEVTETDYDETVPARVEEEPATAISPESDIIYKVKPADTLIKLARKYYGDESKWVLIYNENIGKISHRNALYVGQEIIIPAITATAAEEEYAAPEPAGHIPSPLPPEEDLSSPEGGVGAGERTHTVQKGDTLFKLARQYYNNVSEWKKIYEANRDVIPNPNAVLQGTVLIIPE